MITTRCFGLITKSKSVFQLRPPTAALCSSTAISNSCYHQRIYPTKSNIERNSILFRKSWQHSYLNKYIHSSFPHANKQNTDHKQAAAAVTRQNAVSEVAANDPTEEKLGLFARFKKMSKEYWYVLLPVHVLTSTVWLGGFYYLSVSGVDIIAILEHFKFSEALINPLRDSKLGHIAVAYLCYKIATPLRYTVTLGGTTVMIKTLVKTGHIKPMPTRKELVQIYKDKKEDFQQKVSDKKEEFKQDLRDKKEEIKQEFQDKKEELRQEFQDKKEELKQEFKDKKLELQEKFVKKDK